jgi:predicted dehydrogenase
MSITRRQFLGTAAATSAGLVLGKGLFAGEEPMKTIRLGVIGVGARGTFLMATALDFPDVEVRAVCDIYVPNATEAQNITEKKSGNRPEAYTNGPHDWKRLLERDDLDAVVIATPWELHAQQAIAAMKAAKFVGSEVPSCQTVKDGWDLIKTSEETGMHYMLLENVNYFRNALGVTQLIHEGVLGDIHHAEVGYQHDCRFLAFKEDGTLQWRGENMARLNGNLYPTHPIGPTAWWMNINRGDRFVRLSSMSSKSQGLRNYAAAKFGLDHPLAKRDYALGDTNTSLLETANGKTVTLYFDLCTPRPYDMIFRVQGSKGIYEGTNDRIYIEGTSPKADEWEPFTPKYQEKYEHPIWKEQGAEAVKNGGHGGCDYIVVHEFLKSVRNKTRPPIDVVDSVTWSAIVGLSVESVAHGGKVLEFPDFTKGKWKTNPPA